MGQEHPQLVEAAKLIEQARAIRSEFDDPTAMPAEAKDQVDRLLSKSRQLRQAVEQDAELANHETWLREPDYKFDPGQQVTKEFGHGQPLTDGARAERQRKGFFEFIRKGADRMSSEYKADLVEDSTGELLVPADFSGTILKELPREGTIRGLSTIRPTTSNRVEVGSININQAGWGKLETGATLTDGLGSPPADKDTITVYDLWAEVDLGVDELDDADDNLAQIVREALVAKFAEQEDDAFAAGSGTDRPLGIATDADITQGVVAAEGEVITAEELKSVMFQVPAQFRRARSVWLAHSSAEEQIALLTDANGNFVWQPRVSESEPARLFGHRFHTVDGLPAVDANVNGTSTAAQDKSVFFGDMRSAYMIADRQRVTVRRLDELKAREGKVTLLFRHRVGGATIRPTALAHYQL